MKLDNKPRLRSALRKLYAAKIDWSDSYVRGTAGQEAIDFIAMMAGLKPVYVSGRGFEHEGWHAAVLELAASNGLYVVAGPYWEAGRESSDLPGWFVERVRKGIDEGRAHYVTKARAAADEIKAFADGGRPTIEQEARLLGFPVCCVEAHYAIRRVLRKRGLRDPVAPRGRRRNGNEATRGRPRAGGAGIRRGARPACHGGERPTGAPYQPQHVRKMRRRSRQPAAKLSAAYGALVDTLTGNRRRDPARRRRG